VKAAGTKDTEAVAKKKEFPVDDQFAKGKVLENGRMVHDLYLFEVKSRWSRRNPGITTSNSPWYRATRLFRRRRIPAVRW
jgi:hypothetical protein